MELAFSTRDLRTNCLDLDSAVSAYGPDVAQSLIDRLADLRAANSLMEVLVGSPTFSSNPKPRVVLQLAEDYTLSCSVNHRTAQVDSSGNLDWGRVRRLLVLAIERW